MNKESCICIMVRVHSRLKNNTTVCFLYPWSFFQVVICNRARKKKRNKVVKETHTDNEAKPSWNPKQLEKLERWTFERLSTWTLRLEPGSHKRRVEAYYSLLYIRKNYQRRRPILTFGDLGNPYDECECCFLWILSSSLLWFKGAQ